MTRRDHCYGTEGSIPMSCGSEPRGRALEALVDPARAKGAVRRIGEELGVPVTLLVVPGGPGLGQLLWA